jgi:hypothetical protein
VTNENIEAENQDDNDEAFIKVTNRNDQKKQTKKQQKVTKNNNAERMERANRLLQTTGHESDHEDGKARGWQCRY